MKKVLFLILLANVSLSLSACASTSSKDSQVSKPPLSRHDRLWNPHLQNW
jgi:outer membrane biogenesis lipoprotein LolB